MYTEANIAYDHSFGDHNVSGMLLYNMRNRMVATAGSAIGAIPYRNQAIAGRLSYGWKDRYLAEVNASYTGSENFAPNHRFGFSLLRLWDGSSLTNPSLRGLPSILIY